MATLKIGTVLNNYKITSMIGDNRFGKSYKGQQTLFDQHTGERYQNTVTIDILNIDSMVQQGFNIEVVKEQLKKLIELSKDPQTGRYMCCYHDYFPYVISSQTKDAPASQVLIVMSDFIEGVSLKDILTTRKNNFRTSKLLKIMTDIAEAVDYIHIYGIAHQDIKPSNIVYNKSNDRFCLKDFTESCSSTLNDKFTGQVGTVYYTPPESLEYTGDPSTRSFAYRATHDVWSMGVVFFQAANLRQNYMNFSGTDPAIIAKEIQLEPVKKSTYNYTPINSVISTVLDKNYIDRPTSGQVCILLAGAQPLCTVNGKEFDRSEVEAIVTSFGVNTYNMDSYTLCKILTDRTKKCILKNGKSYEKKELIKIAEILGMNVNESVQSEQLCKKIQKSLQENHRKYAASVTTELTESIEILAMIRARFQGASADDKEKLKTILENFSEWFRDTYIQLSDLDLLDEDVLKNYRDMMDLKSKVYELNSSETYGLLYKEVVNMVDSILSTL